MPSNSAKKKKKNPAWKIPKDFSHKSSAFFLLTGSSKLFAGKVVPTVTIWELLQKVFESDRVKGEQVWEADFIPRKKAIWAGEMEYFLEKEDGWCCSQDASWDLGEKEVKKSLGLACAV